jgi:hypothetical protein
MQKLTVEWVGTVDVPAGKRLVLALEDEAKVDQLHACGGNARCTIAVSCSSPASRDHDRGRAGGPRRPRPDRCPAELPDESQPALGHCPLSEVA